MGGERLIKRQSFFGDASEGGSLRSKPEGSQLFVVAWFRGISHLLNPYIKDGGNGILSLGFQG